ncbi:MAG: acetolactate decarboxylase [Schleiferiaceae bacterium]|nr:acetolactate decarboxylase [Schleiferiaceae bacterium]
MAKNVMMGIDLSPQVQLDTLQPMEHLFALGPVDDLQGEITVIAGQVFYSKAFGDSIVTGIQSDLKAPFLAFSHVEEFDTIPIDLDVTSLKDLESQLQRIRAEYDIADTVAFPFLLMAQDWQSLQIHIIMRDTAEEVHSHDAHKKAKVHFDFQNTSGTLLGFFSTQHEGVFTHKGQFIHVHFLDDENQITGHLDQIQHKGSVFLLLPKLLFRDKE